ncbi:MAG: dihydrolipoyl dehydrogenase [Pirellulaceae bacterium]|nr:dihydrolipoyl dehydrogenase [Pirellulaceae bacterium]
MIGGGPGGYVAAIRAAQLGMSVACIDQHARLGGTCLRVGCIPSKSLLESTERYREARHALREHGVLVGEVSFDLTAMQQRKEQIVETLAKGVAALCQQHQIAVYQGHGRLQGPGQVSVQQGDQTALLGAGRILLATGSRPATLPGVELDGDRIGTSTEALAYDQVPRRLVVIGAGYIGLELGSVWSRLGAEVIVLEALPRVLPGTDLELAKLAQRVFEKQGLQFRLETRVQSARVQDGQCVVACEGAEPIECDRVLLAVGRVANTQDLGLASVGAEVDARGELVIGEDFQTTAAQVYAIGDCVRGPKLAHKASHEAVACIETLAGHRAQVNYDTIPGVVYTHPELASVGKTEEQLKEAGVEYRKGMFPFLASGRARTLGDTEGRVKILADTITDRVLGVHILGLRAGDLIAEAAAAMEFGASAEDLAHVCHAHPTLAESLGEAAAAVHQRAIHVAPPQRARAGKS